MKAIAHRIAQMETVIKPPRPPTDQEVLAVLLNDRDAVLSGEWLLAAAPRPKQMDQVIALAEHDPEAQKHLGTLFASIDRAFVIARSQAWGSRGS